LRKIYFGVFGSGIGHVTRIHDIANELREDGDEFLYSSFDEGLAYLRTNGESVIESPSIDIKWDESGGFSSGASFVRFPLWILKFSRQVGFESGNISKFNPNLVVSESRLSTVFAARSKSHSVITMLNQFKILFPPRFRGKRFSSFYERIAGDFLGMFWSLSDRVLMSDLPPPFTIGEANVAGTDVSKKVEFVGFMSPAFEPARQRLEKAKKTLDLDDRPLVFVQISGPTATKKRFVNIILQSSDRLSKNYNVVVSMGYPGASPEPQRLANGTWLYEWCPIKDELFLLANILVGRSGHRTIGQCIDTGKPAVLIPIYNHSEQIWNAEKFQQLGLGIEIRAEHLDAQKLADSVERCVNDGTFKNNAEKVRAISKRYNGTKRTVEIINSYL
jgi:UDP-N-acetylglucosamine--N-acetylmuramyl-(pentapeptide) pyrophosphoryl-undecaprenol N-acetylglucosamine transferase